MAKSGHVRIFVKNRIVYIGVGGYIYNILHIGKSTIIYEYTNMNIYTIYTIYNYLYILIGYLKLFVTILMKSCS